MLLGEQNCLCLQLYDPLSVQSGFNWITISLITFSALSVVKLYNEYVNENYLKNMLRIRKNRLKVPMNSMHTHLLLQPYLCVFLSIDNIKMQTNLKFTFPIIITDDVCSMKNHIVWSKMCVNINPLQITNTNIQPTSYGQTLCIQLYRLSMSILLHKCIFVRILRRPKRNLA